MKLSIQDDSGTEKGRARIAAGVGTPLLPVLWIRMRMFSGLLDPDPLFSGTDSSPDSDPSVIKQKKKNLDSYCFVTSL